MGWFDSDSQEADAYETVCPCLDSLEPSINWCACQVVNAPHKATLSHELIAAAASYEVRPNTLFCSSDLDEKHFRLPRPTRITARRMVNLHPMQRQKKFCKSANLNIANLKTHYCDCRVGQASLVPSSTVSLKRKGCDCLALTELSYSRHIPFSLILLTKRRPSTTVNIHVPSFF